MKISSFLAVSLLALGASATPHPAAVCPEYIAPGHPCTQPQYKNCPCAQTFAASSHKSSSATPVTSKPVTTTTTPDATTVSFTTVSFTTVTSDEPVVCPQYIAPGHPCTEYSLRSCPCAQVSTSSSLEVSVPISATPHPIAVCPEYIAPGHPCTEAQYKNCPCAQTFPTSDWFGGFDLKTTKFEVTGTFATAVSVTTIKPK